MNGGSKMWRAIAAIAGIVVLDVVLLQQGIDGTVTLICVAAVAGLGGYPISQMVTQFVQKYKP